MAQRNRKDDASARLMGVIAGSATVMALWFYVHPVGALICSSFAILVSVLSIWPPPCPARDGSSLRQKLND
jgi:hypothetical protein